MKIYITYCENSDYKLAEFETKEKAFNWCTKFLIKNEDNNNSWIDHIFEGNLLVSSYKQISKENCLEWSELTPSHSLTNEELDTCNDSLKFVQLSAENFEAAIITPKKKG